MKNTKDIKHEKNEKLQNKNANMEKFIIPVNKKNLFIIFTVIIILLTGDIFFKKSKCEESATNENIKVEFISNNDWTDGNKNYKQYNMTIENISNDVIKNWSVEFEIDNLSEISQLWNGIYNIENGNVTITPVEYNNEIQSNQKIEIGFICVSEKSIEINSYKFYTNNSETVSFENSTTNNNTEKSIVNTRKIQYNIGKNVLIKIMKEGARYINGNITPVGLHKKLSIKGTNIVDYKGRIVQLRGISTHSIYEYSEYINKDTFQEMRDSWGIDVIRIAMYSNPNDGYSSALHEKVKEAVNYASDLGLYVIIDWHILQDNNPNIYKSEAISFFKEMATEFKDNENIIYEICNEPNGDVTWSNDVKPYAEEVIGEIRKIDQDSIIIVGTPTWSQDVDIVADNKIEDYSNIMYALHFYSASHKEDLRNKLIKAINKGLPVFVSEFGISDASGNGSVNTAEGDIWIDLLNSYSISWVCWNLSNKNETSALLKSTCQKLYEFDYEDFSEEGAWLLEKLKE